jgi:hypothetical protein
MRRKGRGQLHALMKEPKTRPRDDHHEADPEGGSRGRDAELPALLRLLTHEPPRGHESMTRPICERYGITKLQAALSKLPAWS